MKFGIAGLTIGPIEAELDRLEGSQLVVRPPSEVITDEEQAAALGLTVQQFLGFKESLRMIRERQ